MPSVPAHSATGRLLKPARYSAAPHSATQAVPSLLRRKPGWQAMHVLAEPVHPLAHEAGQHCAKLSAWQPRTPQSVEQTAVGWRKNSVSLDEKQREKIKTSSRRKEAREDEGRKGPPGGARPVQLTYLACGVIIATPTFAIARSVAKAAWTSRLVDTVPKRRGVVVEAFDHLPHHIARHI